MCRKWFEAVRRDAVTCSPACRERRHRRLRAITPPFPSGTFDLVLVDLPLAWHARSSKGEGRSPQHHYETTDVAALCRLPVADLLAKDAAVCVWVYGPRLPDTLKVIEAWGLTYKSELFTWIKITAAGRPRMGNGKTTRKTSENMWLATRGHGLPIVDHGVSQAIEDDPAAEAIFARRGPHSEKPEEAYQRLERLFGEVRRLDMFARCERPGWTVWGNEIDPQSRPAAPPARDRPPRGDLSTCGSIAC
jgi:N6-adenosine-specific RNA methylase IME4